MEFFNVSMDMIKDIYENPNSAYSARSEFDRIQRQLESYAYYDGRQHELDGILVYPEELPRPPGLDYDPSRFYTNYFKTFIQKKARWQMGGEHKISVQPKEIDSHEERMTEEYEPSPAQLAENKRAAGYENVLYQLWRENRMRERLMQAAKDRLIAGRVAVKLAFNQRTGKLRWMFVPDYEVIPEYSDDDFEELTAVHFVRFMDAEEDGFTRQHMRKQSFVLNYDERTGAFDCTVSEVVYDSQMNVVRTIQPQQSLGIDFIPVVLIPVEDLVNSEVTNDEIRDMRQLTDEINRLNEDSIDALAFEMFPMTAFLNVPEGTTDKINISAGATIEISGSQVAGDNSAAPNIRKVESSFGWSTAFKETYDRLKGALHEVTSVPNIVPTELNFGGMNGEALHVMFHAIITETQEQWLVWGTRLAELHEKSARYLQARLQSQNFAYSREEVAAIGNDYDNEMKFVLPLPDNRKELVELLTVETESGFESLAGAMARLGVEDVPQKMAEISIEKKKAQNTRDPYSAMEAAFTESETPDENPNFTPDEDSE